MSFEKQVLHLLTKVIDRIRRSERTLVRKHLSVLLIALNISLGVMAQMPDSAADALPEAPSYAKISADRIESIAGSAGAASSIISTQVPPAPRFHWGAAFQQSFYLLAIQHGVRMSQQKTREQMRGPFFKSYAESVAGVQGWGDGDSIATNYLGHPMQGAISGYIEIQNEPSGMYEEFGGTQRYWNSRLRAMAWAAAYSTQFEIGPLSEATIGNVGKQKETGGWADFMMTPTGGFGLILAEDALDKFFISRWERTASTPKRRVYRVLLNPCRSFANVLRNKVPWHRDTRPLSGGMEFFDTHRSAPVLKDVESAP